MSKVSFARGAAIIAAAGLAAVAALPAYAEPKPADPAPTAAAAPAQAKPTRYCVVESAFTGTRMPRKTCKTRAQWQSEGYDPAAAQSTK